LRDKDALLMLDKSALPNMKYLGPTFLNGRPHDPNSDYSITKNWGTLGIMWNSEKVAEDIKTWDDLWKLAPKYSGQIILVDSGPDVIGAALKYVGASWNSADKGELDQALDKLIEIKPHVRAFDTTYISKLASEEVWIVVGYNGDAFAANAARAEEGKPESIKYVVPEEGSNVWEDSWVILKDAPHPKAAHAFINFLLDPKIQAIESNFTHYASGVPDADALMKPEVRSNPAIYPPDEVIAKLEAATVLPADILQYREELWTKLKGS
jgi:putrescine transport system substrate-binding protein